MKKTNRPMDQEFLQEQYEEIKIKMLMARFAELEGKTLLEENEELSKDSFYLPSERERKSFIKRLNVHFAFLYLKKSLSIVYSKAAVVSLLIIVILFTTLFSVEAVRVRVLNMFVQVKNEYTEIWLERDSQQLEESNIQVEWDYAAYAPTKVPMGYQIVDVKNLENMHLIEYENDDHDIILFQQNNNNSGLNVDTEDAEEVIPTTIGEQDGLTVLKNDQITVIWQNETQLFLITGKSESVSREELIGMAESVTLHK